MRGEAGSKDPLWVADLWVKGRALNPVGKSTLHWQSVTSVFLPGTFLMCCALESTTVIPRRSSI